MLHFGEKRRATVRGRIATTTARGLFRVLPGGKTFAPLLSSSFQQQLKTKLRVLDTKRLALRKAITFNRPLAARPSPLVSATVPTTGQFIPPKEVAFFGKTPLSRAGITTAVSLPTAPSAVVAVTTYPANRHAALSPAYTHQKKRTLYQLGGRKSRFSRYIPAFIKRRLARENVELFNHLALPGLRAPVIRYARFVYPQGSRVFASYHRGGRRIKARRLVNQRR